MSFVRSSKFRHVFGTPNKPDACFTDLKTEGTGDTNCSVSNKFFAMIKSSKIYVVALDKTGRQEENTMNYIDCKAKVLDLAWSPFDDCVLASSEETGDINVWMIPEEGLKSKISEPFWELHGVHMRKVTFLCWHPTAEYVLATGGFDPFVTIWDCENQTKIYEITVGEAPTSFCWNKDGSRAAITTKENRVMTLSVVDPRTGDAISTNKECHKGTKATKCLILNNGNVITAGSDKQANRSICMWDKDDVNNLIFELDAGNSSAVLNLFYDPDLELLYTFGKGESVIKYYEIEDKEIFFLSLYQSTESQKGGNFLPKRGVDYKSVEIARFFKLAPTKCEPITFVVPRKSDHFQEELFPPCACGEKGMSADEWREGKNCNPPVRDIREMEGACTAKAHQPKKTSTKPMAKKIMPRHSNHQESNGIPAGLDFAELLEDMKKLKSTVKKLSKRVTTLEEKFDGENAQNGAEEEEEEEEE